MNKSPVKIKLKKRAFNDAYLPFRKCDTRIQIFFGGSSSGKSVSIADRAVQDLLEGGRNYLICRNVGDSINRSTFKEIRKSISRHKADDLFKINRSTKTITAYNGYEIVFCGLDDVEKIKSITPTKGVITDIWVEEATETKYEAIKQLRKRLRGKSKKKKRIVLSMNPIMKSHWIYTEYFKGRFGDADRLYHDGFILILKTTYKDNKFLEQDDIDELENETDSYFYNVYTLGNWGILGDLIFRNWEEADLSKQIKSFDNIRNGLDFGYSNDPTAFVRCHYDRKNKIIYIFKEAGGKGLTNPDVAAILKPIIRNEYLSCDAAEPKSIEELKRHGINALPSQKGADSIVHGIQWLQQHKIIVDKSCQEVINELSQYQWTKTKDGTVINRPVDRNNHWMDALRYAFEREIAGAYAECDLG